jgi:tetratricopeptide (TPR) repeat protein
VEWASRRIAGLDFVQATQIEVPRNHEAQAWEHYTNGNWKEALDESWKWLYDQPISPRPAHLGSFIACSVLENPEESERILKCALLTNPSDGLLLNNLAFTYATAGRIKEAQETLTKIKEIEGGESTGIAMKATQGLIHFRSGNPDIGRRLYREALEGSLRYSRNFQAMAALYYAREELLVNSPEAQQAMRIAIDLAKGLEDRDIVSLAKRVGELASVKTQNAFKNH